MPKTILGIGLFFVFLEVCATVFVLKVDLKKTFPAPDWQIGEITAKLAYFSEQKQIDVLFVGDSHAERGVNPYVFDPAYAGRTGLRVVSFNGAIGGLNTEIIDILVRYFYSSAAVPKCVIFGLTARMLNSGNEKLLKRTDSFLEENGIKKVLKRNGHQYRKLNLFYYRSIVHSMILDRLSLSPINQQNFRRMKDGLTHFNKAGFVGIGQYSLPVDFHRRLERELEFLKQTVPSELKPFAIHGPLIESCKSIAQWCRQNNVRLVFVNMPVRKIYYAHFPSSDYHSYLFSINDIAEQYRVSFWNIHDEFDFRDDEFLDITHLNIEGARRLSEILAEKYAQKAR